jgi:hypothetical protein
MRLEPNSIAGNWNLADVSYGISNLLHLPRNPPGAPYVKLSLVGSHPLLFPWQNSSAAIIPTRHPQVWGPGARRLVDASRYIHRGLGQGMTALYNSLVDGPDLLKLVHLIIKPHQY